jgi:DNA repair ATPase RecN
MQETSIGNPASREGTMNEFADNSEVYPANAHIVSAANAAKHYINTIDLQPLLTKNIEDLLSSLHTWSRSVHREVEHLNNNSTILQNALKKFDSSLPQLSGQRSAMNGLPAQSQSDDARNTPGGPRAVVSIDNLQAGSGA